jgi:uncharacterized membrane protein YidH (DUF202 family)
VNPPTPAESMRSLAPMVGALKARADRGTPADVEANPDPRVTFANERTFLAWTRTSLALIGAGLAVAQFLKLDTRVAPLITGIGLIAPRRHDFVHQLSAVAVKPACATPPPTGTAMHHASHHRSRGRPIRRRSRRPGDTRLLLSMTAATRDSHLTLEGDSSRAHSYLPLKIAIDIAIRCCRVGRPGAEPSIQTAQ